MSRCDVVGTQKPHVWKDDDGWTCTQCTICRSCLAASFERIVDEATWEDAMRASQDARPVEPKEIAPG